MRRAPRPVPLSRNIFRFSYAPKAHFSTVSLLVSIPAETAELRQRSGVSADWRSSGNTNSGPSPGVMMSDWDSGRPSAGHFDVPRPPWLDGATYPYPLPFPLAQALEDDDPPPPDPRAGQASQADQARQQAGQARQQAGQARQQAGQGRQQAGQARQQAGQARQQAGQARQAAPGAGELPNIGRPPWEVPPAGRPGQSATGGQFAGWPSQSATGSQPAAGGQFAAGGPEPATEEFYFPDALRGGAAGGREGAGPGGRHRRGGRRWLIPAGVVTGAAVMGAAAIMLTGSHRSGQHAAAGPATATPTATARMAVRIAAKPSQSPSPSPSAPTAATAPLTLAQAQAAVARYTSVNNAANAQRSAALLATVEGGSSDTIDAGQYRVQQAAQTAPYPPFSPVQATYYLPAGEPAGGPRWFVVQVANAFTSSPSTVTSDEYLLFTQPTPGGAWVNTIEPYLLASATAPQIAVSADGLATSVSPDAATLAVAPGQLSAVTAASLDGTRSGSGAVADPGNLADQAAAAHFARKLPAAAVTDTHIAAAGADGQEFALLTTTGGALVFYSDAAGVTVTPPSGSGLHLTVPGFYSAGQELTQARLSYLEQFAAYDPPAAAGGSPRVVADYSGIAGTN
jgi:hypothetical protein